MSKRITTDERNTNTNTARVEKPRKTYYPCEACGKPALYPARYCGECAAMVAQIEAARNG